MEKVRARVTTSTSKMISKLTKTIKCNNCKVVKKKAKKWENPLRVKMSLRTKEKRTLKQIIFKIPMKRNNSMEKRTWTI
jgi:hypothetical protein